MIYILYGSNDYLIKQEISKILKNIDKINIINYNLENTDINKIIDDTSTINIFNDDKGIIVDNSYIFHATTNKKQMEQNTDNLEKYINNYNPNTILIFVTNNIKLDERKKIVKLIRKQGKVLEFNNSNNVFEITKKMFDKYNIDNQTLHLFLDRVGDNLYLIQNEVSKVLLYKENDKNITKEDILLLTNKNINLDIFNLIENIVNGNKELAYEEYKEIVKLGEEPIKILIMLANQFRIIYQSKELLKKGYMEKDIANILDIHPYRIKLALSKSGNYNNKTILNYIYTLSLLDIDIKTGKIEPNLALELFILNIK